MPSASTLYHGGGGGVKDEVSILYMSVFFALTGVKKKLLQERHHRTSTRFVLGLCTPPQQKSFSTAPVAYLPVGEVYSGIPSIISGHSLPVGEVYGGIPPIISGHGLPVGEV